MSERSLKIAVIGSGAAGLTTSHLLQRQHDVTLLEKEGRLGGHTCTVTLEDGPDAGTPVDTGFIVMNHRNYPLLTRLLEHLGVTLRDSNMSFGYHDVPSGLQYSGSGLDGLFAQRGNLVNPVFWRMLMEVTMFFRLARRDLRRGLNASETLGEYLERNGFSSALINHHLIPMGSAIWSTPCDEMLRFPALSFLNFFQNHGLLTIRNRPQWKTVHGGSATYICKMQESWRRVEVRLNIKIDGILRKESGVAINFADGTSEAFDHVVLATHADQAFRLLTDPDEKECAALGCWQYANSRTLLHNDYSVLPPLKKIWSSWNFQRVEGSRTSLTYDMNRLQGLTTVKPLLVTLNPTIEPAGVIREFDYEHPMFTAEALAQRPVLKDLNGRRGTWYAGSYFGNGFHEDAVRAGVDVAKGFGIEL